VSVADTGAGIPPEMLPRIFEMFTQLQPPRDRTLGGLGIGLTLAKRLVELHGGSIEAHSDGLGRGSTFAVRVPLAPVTERQAETDDSSETRAGHACRVLVADDNADALEMMRLMLDLKGHEVRIAADGLQAIDVAERFQPHIAFLDIGMPRMDGYEAARQLRDRFGSGLVLVALTGWGQDEDKHRAAQSGFDHHLTKPPEPEVLEALIETCERRGRGR
jgi:CheY-like chemotaxis protein